ncbi:hypothetical protein SEA_GUDMIT_34 [Gordonia phage Gudmit]|nr:hypothetical protein SEA_GUDMIT_34 [Gordonia phage Gudmit]
MALNRRQWILAVAVSVVAFLALVGVIVTVAGVDTDGSARPAAVSSSSSSTPAPDPTSRAGLSAAALKHCDVAVRLDWMREPGASGDAQILTPWEVTVADPAGGTPGASWRLSAQYLVGKTTDRGRKLSWEQNYWCDLEYVGGEYTAKLVG